MNYARAFAVVSDHRFFAGLWATLGSVFAYYEKTMRVFVVGHDLTTEQRAQLGRHPLGSALTVLDTKDFAHHPCGCWEAKQQCASELVAEVETLCLLDADLVLLSRIDDVFDLAEQGLIVSSRDGSGITYGEQYAVYHPTLVGQRRPYVNSGFLALNIRKHWDIIALWAFTSRFASYSPGNGAPFGFPGHGDQGLLNAIIAQLQRSDVVHVLPEHLWCNSSGWCNGRSVRIEHGDGAKLTVRHLPGGETQRVLHSTGPKWWTEEGKQAFAEAGDVLACFESMAQVSSANLPSTETVEVAGSIRRSWKDENGPATQGLQERNISNINIGIVIGTYASVPYIHLQVEARRRFYPEVPALVHDDASIGAKALADLCDEYDVDFESNSTHQPPYAGDLSVFVGGLLWARERQLNLLLKVSRRWIFLTDWRPSLIELAAESDYPTIGQQGWDDGFRLRTECLALRVDDWTQPLAMQELMRPLQYQHTLFVEDHIYRLARRLEGTLSPQAIRWRHGHAVPETLKGVAHWGLIEPRKSTRSDHYLWHDAASPEDYAQIARSWGLNYTAADFENLLETRRIANTVERLD